MDGILCINKPANMTSFDVCAQIRRKFHCKVGHTGTLDPMATGVMMITLGKSTKLVQYLTHARKTYQAVCRLGVKTNTGDIWGEVTERGPIPELMEGSIEPVLASFLGKSMQQPPMISAIKIDGKKLYEYARKNQTIDVPMRPIEVFSIKLDGIRENELVFTIEVSAGTYIRTICEDIGVRMNTVATLSGLERLAIEDITINQTMELDEVLGTSDLMFVDPLIALKKYRQITVEDPTFIYHGKKVDLPFQDDKILFVFNNEPLAFYKKEDNLYRSERGLW
ncbi:MAG: tRNA pseudouridine(55) synthase TruB [Erysipelotrichaceae bacterium]|nr:tRNA pseudouridine(55) synthase TruB [Erysipelotrichaceae bacterium]MDP3306254.1 tRNA pseudouridine(55) synthase TruB [Erysipelotrichaceae bacterium]